MKTDITKKAGLPITDKILEGTVRKVFRCHLPYGYSWDDLFQEARILGLKAVSTWRPGGVQLYWWVKENIRWGMMGILKKAANRNRLASQHTSYEEYFACSHYDIEVKQEPSLDIEDEAAYILSKLPPLSRRVFFLKYCEQWTYNRIAKDTGLNFHQVKEILYQGKKFLRNLEKDSSRP